MTSSGNFNKTKKQKPKKKTNFMTMNEKQLIEMSFIEWTSV